MSDKVAAGYIRVSTPKQRDEGSHERQEERLREWADSHGYELTVYRDIAESGQSVGRESYNEMMDNLENFDAVVVRELSRLGRSVAQLCEDVERMEDLGVDFVSLRENLDTTTAQGKLIFNVMAAIAQFKSDLARERTLERHQRAKDNGEGWGRPEKLSKEKIKELLEYREEKELSYTALAKIFRDYTEDGKLARSTVKRYVDRYSLEDGELVKDE